MFDPYEIAIKPLLFSVDAEKAHGLSIAALKAGAHPRYDAEADPRLHVELAGLSFPNPLGMAAGYDKNAEVPDALLRLGFGHAEIGTVTPQPQPGNPKPRIFRLIKDRGVINRLGFNSQGHAVARSRLELRAAAKKPRSGIVGVNIGANKSSADFIEDYVAGIRAFANLATYFTVNISSPNTPGLRALQDADPLAELLQKVSEARAQEAETNGRRVPLFLKVAPDLDERAMDAIASVLEGSEVDALIVSNTTLSRDGLRSIHKDEAGGLSGKPLFELSTIVLAKMFQRISLPLIGVGGVTDAATAFTKLEAGAQLVQLYSGMIYGGPFLPGRIVAGLSKRLTVEGLSTVSQVTGRTANEWAERTLD